MKQLVCCTFVATVAMAQNFPIDHVTVAGKDLQAMTESLRKATGIMAEYGGPHSNHATEMALASFPDGSYLELIAIQPKADPAALAAHYWHKFMEADAGPCAWAIRPTHFDAEVERLRRSGVAVTGPNRAGRKRPDGVELDWATAQVGPTNGGFFPFLIHDFTPRDSRAFPGGKPTSAKFSGIVKVVIGVRDLNDAIARYRHGYELGAPEQRDDSRLDAHLASFPGTPVVLAAPLSQRSWLNDRLEHFGEAPCAFILGAPGQSRFGDVFWFDSNQLGWHLGFETK